MTVAFIRLSPLLQPPPQAPGRLHACAIASCISVRACAAPTPLQLTIPPQSHSEACKGMFDSDDCRGRVWCFEHLSCLLIKPENVHGFLIQCDIQTNVSLVATGVSYNHNRHPLAHKRQRGDEGELGRTVFGPMRCITNGKRQEARAKGVKFYPRAHARAAGTRERWDEDERTRETLLKATSKYRKKQ